jgi:hypothetical protein
VADDNKTVLNNIVVTDTNLDRHLTAYYRIKATDIRCIREMHKSRVSGCHENYLVFGGAQYLWFLSIKLSSCHPSGT